MQAKVCVGCEALCGRVYLHVLDVCAAASGDIVNMKELGVWEPLMVKTQTFKTAIEAGRRGVGGWG